MIKINHHQISKEWQFDEQEQSSFKELPLDAALEKELMNAMPDTPLKDEEIADDPLKDMIIDEVYD